MLLFYLHVFSFTSYLGLFTSSPFVIQIFPDKLNSNGDNINNNKKNTGTIFIVLSSAEKSCARVHLAPLSESQSDNISQASSTFLHVQLLLLLFIIIIVVVAMSLG